MLRAVAMCHSANDRADSGGDGGIPRRRAAAKAPQIAVQCLFHHSDDQIAPSDLPAEVSAPPCVPTLAAAVSASRLAPALLPADLANSSNETAPAAMTVRAPHVRTSATMRARNRSARARPIVALTRAREATRLAPPNAPRHMARPPDPVLPPAERGRREGGLRAVRPCRLRCGHLHPLGTPTARAPWTKSPPWPPLCIIRRCAASNALHGALLSPSEVPVPRGEMAHSHTHSPATPQARSRSTTLARWCARSGSTRRRVTCPVPVAARRTSRRCRRSSRSWTSQSRPSRTSSPR